MSKSDEAESAFLDLFNVASADTSGRPERFNAVVTLMHRTYGQDVLQVARARGPEGSAEDIASATWEAVRGALESFKVDSSFRTWLLRIATNKAIDEMRRRKGEQQDALREVLSKLCLEAPSRERPSRVVAREQIDRLVREFIEQLEPGDEEVLLLHYHADQSVAEIGAALGVLPNTVAKRLGRAKLRLQKLFEAAGFTGE